MSGRRGVVLVTVLWILFFVGVIALGLGRLGREELSLLKLSSGRLRAYAAARSGLAAAEQRLLNASTGSGQRQTSLQERQKLYAGIPVGEEVFFDVGWGSGCRVSSACWGPRDESARYNVNLIDAPGVEADILRLLVESVAPGEGEAWVKGIIDFRNGPQRKGKTRPFYVLEELLYVPGITHKTFNSLRDMLTVFPYVRTAGSVLSLLEADPLLVSAVFMASGAYAGSNASADARYFLQCRERSADPARDCLLPGYLGFLIRTGSKFSGLFRIRSTGVDRSAGVRLTIEEVVDISEVEPEIKIVFWQRD